MKFYAKDGRQITLDEWSAELWNEDNRRVALTVASDLKHRVHTISTVWLGLDHSFGAATVPLIFETMVFCEDHVCGWYQDCSRYSTQEQALEGHELTSNLVQHKLK